VRQSHFGTEIHAQAPMIAVKIEAGYRCRRIAQLCSVAFHTDYFNSGGGESSSTGFFGAFEQIDAAGLSTMPAN
jgi:hypothetical protein